MQVRDTFSCCPPVNIRFYTKNRSRPVGRDRFEVYTSNQLADTKRGRCGVLTRIITTESTAIMHTSTHISTSTLMRRIIIRARLRATKMDTARAVSRLSRLFIFSLWAAAAGADALSALGREAAGGVTGVIAVEETFKHVRGSFRECVCTLAPCGANCQVDSCLFCISHRRFW